MARYNYDLQLKELKNRIMLLGSQVETIISDTIDALVNQNVEEADAVIRGDDSINEETHRIERMCYDLLMRQAPVAKDLRMISAALKMITDMERIADHGCDISELTVSMADTSYPEEIELVKQMSKNACVMLIEAINAYAMEDEKKAREVLAMDDLVDEQFIRVKESIAHSIDRGNTMDQLDLFLAAKYLERIGDHATNIAEWVLFSITGVLPED